MKAGDGSEFFTVEDLEKADDYFVLVEREDDYCATAYWYLDKPENKLPAIPLFAERTQNLP